MLELNKIYQKCCIQGIQEIKSNSINLIIADPPYGISKKKPLKGSSKGKIVTLNESWDDFDSKSDQCEGKPLLPPLLIKPWYLEFINKEISEIYTAKNVVY